jgi:hypothetical protein
MTQFDNWLPSRSAGTNIAVPMEIAGVPRVELGDRMKRLSAPTTKLSLPKRRDILRLRCDSSITPFPDKFLASSLRAWRIAGRAGSDAGKRVIGEGP